MEGGSIPCTHWTDFMRHAPSADCLHHCLQSFRRGTSTCLLCAAAGPTFHDPLSKSRSHLRQSCCSPSCL